jgi:murein DD-endopeptidase MepM/ murein hydrolase activator NlpD
MVIPSMLPAYAYLTEPAIAQTADAEQSTAQSLAVGGGVATSIVRDGYGVTEKPKPKLPTFVASSAKSYSSVAGTFVNDPTSAVQWPFTQGVPISSGFGPRSVAGCGFCSTNHQGLDMNPGAGTPIQAIADGVVAEVGNPSGAYGVWIIIDHVVDGQKVSSMYAHMLLGSLELSVGDTVTVGQIIGAVGSTGASTGAHLHFEIRIDGTLPVDPYAWLKGQVGS